VQFKDLKIGDTFDFVDDKAIGYNSFFERCTKITARKYKSETDVIYRVGKITCEVFHVVPITT